MQLQSESGGAPRARRQLASRMVPRVRSIARRVARRLPTTVDVDDLVQAGLVGVLGALARATDGRDATLEEYLARRAHGAILDELRALDPLSRGERRDARSLARSAAALRGRLGREPSGEDVARDAGIDPARQRAIEARAADRTRPPGAEDAVADGAAVDPLAALLAGERRRRLGAALGLLRDRHRQVLCMVYGADASLGEIAARFGVTSSRVCQLHREALAEMRKVLGDS